MVNKWGIKVFESSSKHFENILEKSLHDKSIGIGFGIHNDFNNTTTLERRTNWEIEGLTDRQIQHKERMFNMFLYEMNIGDTVFLCKGKDKILYIADVAGDYYHDPSYLMIDPKLGVIGTPHRRHICNVRPFKVSVENWNYIQTIFKV